MKTYAPTKTSEEVYKELIRIKKSYLSEIGKTFSEDEELEFTHEDNLLICELLDKCTYETGSGLGMEPNFLENNKNASSGLAQEEQ